MHKLSMTKKMQVVKRNGKKEDVSFDKVITRIKHLCAGLETIEPIVIAQKVCNEICDGITTSQLDEFAGETCVALMTLNPEYGILAGRIVISNNHKNTSPSFSETMTALYNNVDFHGKSSPLLATHIYQAIMANKDKLNSVIDYNRDYNFDYFAYKTLEKAYLMQVKGRVVERIQHVFMRVSVGIHGDDITRVIESYEYMSRKYFTHATPTLYHSGTPRPQLLSCFLLGTEDSIDGIYKTIADCAKISKWAGGIGVHISNVRSKDTRIRGTNGKSDGIIPMLKVYNDTARYVNQSGKRKGSFAIYLEPWHPDVMEFLDLKKNTGKDEIRARDLFLALWIPDIFMRRVEQDAQWSLFDPDECPGLTDVYGQAFDKLYLRYESEGRAKHTMKASELWRKALESQIETGVPYIGFKDQVNAKNNQNHYGIIKSSNLCIEINEYSDSKEYACCTLSSIGLPSFVEGMKFNYDKLVDVLKVIVINLNRIIDLNHYPVPETELSNRRHRPLGIGVQGLADVFIKMRAPFESDRARELNRNIFEAIYYGAVRASCDLAKAEGTYETFPGSPMSRGIFQFDMWGVTPSDRWDWATLRADVIKYGIRNSLLMALMPTASTSQILGFNEAFEPITSNIYTRGTIAGDFVLVNRYLVDDLIKLGMWGKEMKDAIVACNGSIQSITTIPQELRDLYKTVWEISQKRVIELSADRGAFVCQTQSMNLFFDEPTPSVLHSALFYGWRKGLKTGSYYIRSRPKVQAQQFTIEPANNNNNSNVQAEKLMCSLKNPEGCEACAC